MPDAATRLAGGATISWGAAASGRTTAARSSASRLHVSSPAPARIRLVRVEGCRGVAVIWGGGIVEVAAGGGTVEVATGGCIVEDAAGGCTVEVAAGGCTVEVAAGGCTVVAAAGGCTVEVAATTRGGRGAYLSSGCSLPSSMESTSHSAVTGSTPNGLQCLNFSPARPGAGVGRQSGVLRHAERRRTCTQTGAPPAQPHPWPRGR